MNEIKINNPAKPFTFVEEGLGWGQLYFRGKLVDTTTGIHSNFPEYYMVDLDNYREYTEYDPDVEKYINTKFPTTYPLIDKKYVEVRSSIGEIKILTPGRPFKFVLDRNSEDWGKLYFRDELIDNYTSTSDKYIGYSMLNRRYREDANYNPETEEYFSKDAEISQFIYLMIPKKYVEVRIRNSISGVVSRVGTMGLSAGDSGVKYSYISN